MDYVVCPRDGAQLKATGRRAAGLPLVLSCPTCGRQFTFGTAGLREIPPGDDPSS